MGHKREDTLLRESLAITINNIDFRSLDNLKYAAQINPNNADIQFNLAVYYFTNARDHNRREYYRLGLIASKRAADLDSQYKKDLIINRKIIEVYLE